MSDDSDYQVQMPQSIPISSSYTSDNQIDSESHDVNIAPDDDDMSVVQHHNTVTVVDEMSGGNSASASVSASSVLECDIGKLLADKINLHHLNRENKYQILKHEPSSNATYPRTRCYESDSFRRFKPIWLNKYPWIHYSHHVDGVFCRACALFAGEQLGGQSPGQFITLPFKNWVVQSQKMKAHARSAYHMTAMVRMNEFLIRYQNPALAINVQHDRRLQEIFIKIQNVLKSLFKIVLLIGKQGIAFRGHRDDNIVWFEEESDFNQGNFVELVRFRAETDKVLQDHLMNAPRNAQYTSKTIQNEMIGIVGKHIRDEILLEVNTAKYFSVIADEVTDISNKEQLSITIRYVLGSDVKEMFLDFVEVQRITGKEIADAILGRLTAWKLCIDNLRGQCYDGSSNMAGAKSGCRALIQQQAPLALYTHCAAHQLNLAIVAACKVQVFRNTESCIGEIARFFKASPKRQRLLDKAMEVSNPAPKAKKLKDACRTRWIQRIDSYVVFLELLPSVHMTLQAINSPSQYPDLGTEWNWDGETTTKANGFLYQLESSSFLISFKILLEVRTVIP